MRTYLLTLAFACFEEERSDNCLRSQLKNEEEHTAAEVRIATSGTIEDLLHLSASDMCGS